MTTNIAITEARVNLGALVKRVNLNKESFILEKDGFPVACLVDIDTIEDFLDANNPKTKKLLATTTKEYKSGKYSSARNLLK